MNSARSAKPFAGSVAVGSGVESNDASSLDILADQFEWQSSPLRSGDFGKSKSGGSAYVIQTVTLSNGSCDTYAHRD